VFHVTRFMPDQDRMSEFIACLWQGPVPEDLVVHEWLYLQPRGMLLIWEGDEAGAAYVERAFGGFGSLETETVTNATRGLVTCMERDLEGFGSFLRTRGSNEEDITAQLDLRRRGLNAATLDEAAAAGRSWRAERS
jgi:hypothetical protein